MFKGERTVKSLPYESWDIRWTLDQNRGERRTIKTEYAGGWPTHVGLKLGSRISEAFSEQFCKTSTHIHSFDSFERMLPTLKNQQLTQKAGSRKWPGGFDSHPRPRARGSSQNLGTTWEQTLTNTVQNRNA
jgi:hypothetical protein